MTREEIEAGLADGTLERGVTRRYARGTGTDWRATTHRAITAPARHT